MTLIPAQDSKAQRRLLTTLGGLGVVALAAATFVLSYDDLRTLAIRGGAARQRAFLYPGMIDGLVVVVTLAILTARRAGWLSRAVRWLLLLLLIAGAGAAGVQRAVRGYDHLPHAWVRGGVAAAPWVILVIAVWLWVSMIKQALSRRRHPAPDPAPGTLVDQSIVPGLADEETRPLPRPAAVRELEPAREPALEPAAVRQAPPLPASWDEVAEPANAGPAEHVEPVDATDEMVEAPMNDTPAEPVEDDDPTPRLVARTSLPTDVRLVGGPQDTQPDGIKLPDTQPDGIPIVGTAEEDHEAYTDERAEDPDAGNDTLGGWAAEKNMASIPPSSRFRSSPTPPRD
jgi:hypothetical protein